MEQADHKKLQLAMVCSWPMTASVTHPQHLKCFPNNACLLRIGYTWKSVLKVPVRPYDRLVKPDVVGLGVIFFIQMMVLAHISNAQELQCIIRGRSANTSILASLCRSIHFSNITRYNSSMPPHKQCVPFCCRMGDKQAITLGRPSPGE